MINVHVNIIVMYVAVMKTSARFKEKLFPIGMTQRKARIRQAFTMATGSRRRETRPVEDCPCTSTSLEGEARLRRQDDRTETRLKSPARKMKEATKYQVSLGYSTDLNLRRALSGLTVARTVSFMMWNGRGTRSTKAGGGTEGEDEGRMGKHGRFIRKGTEGCGGNFRRHGYARAERIFR